VPEAARASRMTSFDENLPVPSMRREEKVRSAMTRGADTAEERLIPEHQAPGPENYGKLRKAPQKNLSDFSERFF